MVYIEGDGHAWKNRWTPSRDPTPWNPIALRLAVQDPTSKVMYLAQPCQLNTDSSQNNCHPKYWTSHRYSQKIINSFHDALDQAKALSHTEQIVIIGYSGGGAVAALLSAQRNDVTQIITIAANLDLSAWVKKHGISKLSDSLNPADFVSKLQYIPQIHLMGEKDDIVPPAIFQSYFAKLGNTDSLQWAIIPDYDHKCCWVDSWSYLYTKYLIKQASD